MQFLVDALKSRDFLQEKESLNDITSDFVNLDYEFTNMDLKAELGPSLNRHMEKEQQMALVGPSNVSLMRK